MEQAFNEAGEAYDLVFYRPSRSRDDGPPAFWHRRPDGRLTRVEGANAYPYRFGRFRSTVLKIHGTIDQSSSKGDGFVITEDDYIEYLVRQPLETSLPQALLGQVQTAHLLFLGYSLRDWNFRVFLRRLWTDEVARHRAWAVMRFESREEFDVESPFWRGNGVEVFSLDLEDYVQCLIGELERMDESDR
jgi:hypothetical protein